MISESMDDFDELLQTYDDLLLNKEIVYRQWIHYISYQQAEKKNFKNQIQQLKIEMKQNEDRLMEQNKDEVEVMTFEILELREQLKEKEIRIKDLEVEISKNVVTPKCPHCAPSTENCHESLVETSAQDLFSSFHMGAVNYHAALLNRQLDEQNLLPITERTVENLPPDLSTSCKIFNEGVEKSRTFASSSPLQKSTPIVFLHKLNEFQSSESKSDFYYTAESSSSTITNKRPTSSTSHPHLSGFQSSESESDFYYTAAGSSSTITKKRPTSSTSHPHLSGFQSSENKSDFNYSAAGSSNTITKKSAISSTSRPNLSGTAFGEKKTFFCDGCGEIFFTKKRLRIHIQKNFDFHDRQFKCELRTSSSKNKGNKITKFRKRSDFECAICNKVFIRKWILQQHLKIHNNKRPFICEFCGKTFNYSGALTVHKRIHNNERPFACEICGKTFNQNVHLIVHKRIHNGERPFVCEICGKTFNHSGALTIHKRIHNGERPFVCEICGKTFISSGELIYHKRIHDEGPFVCEVCGKTFTQSGTLTRHKRIHHSEQPFNCAVCERTFRWKSSLKTHIEKHMKNSK